MKNRTTKITKRFGCTPRRKQSWMIGKLAIAFIQAPHSILPARKDATATATATSLAQTWYIMVQSLYWTEVLGVLQASKLKASTHETQSRMFSTICKRFESHRRTENTQVRNFSCKVDVLFVLRRDGFAATINGHLSWSSSQLLDVIGGKTIWAPVFRVALAPASKSHGLRQHTCVGYRIPTMLTG